MTNHILIPGNQLKDHQVWDSFGADNDGTSNSEAPAVLDWVPGQPKGYAEGETAAFRVEVQGIEGEELKFVISLDLFQEDSGGIKHYAFTDIESWDTTFQQDGTHLDEPPLVSELTGEVDGVNAANAEIDTVSFLGTQALSGSVTAQLWEVEFTLESDPTVDSDGDGDLTNDPVTAYIVYGGHIAAPGDSIASGGNVPDGQGASTVSGTFQARIESDGGDKTVNFKGNLIASAAQPALNLVKTANVTEVDSTGDTITYTYILTNTVEGSEATNITLIDDNATPGNGGDDFSPTFVGGDTDDDGNLDFGETWTYEETTSVTQAQIDSGADIVNIASADSEETDPVTDRATVDVIQDPQLSIDKIVVDSDNDGWLWNDDNGNNLPDAGETIDYSIKVSNDGNVTLTNVTVEDPMLGIDENVGDLAVGAMTTVNGSYTLTQNDINAGEKVNTATAVSDQTPLEEDTETVPLPQDPDVDLVKDVELTIDVDQSQDVSAGDELTYTFTIENTGNVTLTDVEIVDPLPGLSAIDFGTFDGTLAPGESVEGTATYTVTANDVENGEINNTATVTAEASGGDPNDPDDDVTDTDTAEVDVPQPALGIEKTYSLLDDADGSQDISVGDIIRYTVEVSNTGAANLTDVNVVDSLADAFLTLSDDTGDGVGFLAAGDSETAIFDYEVTAADVANGSILNTATADSVQTDPIDDSVTVEVPQPELAIDKMFVDFVDRDANGEVTQGDILNYDVKVSSTGTANLTDVTVTDPLTGLDETIDFLAAGDMQTFSTSYTVTEQDALTGEVLNTAVADSTQTDPEDDSEDVPVKLAVEIDIKPGSFPSSFNLIGRGTVPVAIFSTDSFDATTITTVSIEEFDPGPSTGTATTTTINFSDVNSDGLLDAVAQFRKPTLIGVLDTDSEFAKLTGTTNDGIMFVGIGDVNVTQI